MKIGMVSFCQLLLLLLLLLLQDDELINSFSPSLA